MSIAHCTAAVTASNHYPRHYLPTETTPQLPMAEDLDDARFWLPAHFLDDDDGDPPPDEHDGGKSGPMAFSPPSTLYGMGCWSSSGRESSTEGSSTPPSPLSRDNSWDLLKLDDDDEESPSKKEKKRVWGRGAARGAATVAPLGLSPSAWPALGAARPGMRAVFIQQGGRKEPSGTGVFLPRTPQLNSQPRRKASGSTLLLPAKVVQALTTQGRLGGRSGLDHDAIFVHNVTLLQNRGLLPRPFLPEPAAGSSAVKDVDLPSEWTY